MLSVKRGEAGRLFHSRGPATSNALSPKQVLGSWQWIHEVAVSLPCNVKRGSGMTCHWTRQAAAPCNVAGGSGITRHWNRSTSAIILLLVSISAISAQSCHSAPVCEIFIQIGPPSSEKMTSCRFSRWRISAILDFSGPIMGSLKSPRTISYRPSIDTIAVNCLFFEKIAFLHFGDRQTNRWTGPLMKTLAVASGGWIT